MPHHTRHESAEHHTHTSGDRRACVRRAVTVRVDYATADGRAWLGVERNLSPQGMFIDSALCHVAHDVAPGNLLTAAFVVPSGRPCKLRAIVIHGGRRECGVEFLERPPPSLAPLAHAGLSLDAEDARGVGWLSREGRVLQGMLGLGHPAKMLLCCNVRRRCSCRPA